MNAIVLSRALPDFGSAVTVKKQDYAPEFANGHGGDLSSPVTEEKEISFVSDEDIRLAFEAGFTEGKAEASALHTAGIADLKAQYTQQLADLKEEVSARAASKFAKSLENALFEIERALSAQIGAILLPLYQQKLEQKTIDEFADKIVHAAKESRLIEVKGSQRLCQMLKKTAAMRGMESRFVETESDELSFVCENTIVETQISLIMSEFKAVAE